MRQSDNPLKGLSASRVVYGYLMELELHREKEPGVTLHRKRLARKHYLTSSGYELEAGATTLRAFRGAQEGRGRSTQ